MEVNPLQCIKFSGDTLAHVILSASTAQSIDAVTRKTQFKYLCNYLDHAFDESRSSPYGLCARTMVVEGDYLDPHYLEDYSRYYAKGFQTFSNKCVRIHFFRPLLKAKQHWGNLSSEQSKLADFFLEKGTNQQKDLGFFKTLQLRNDFAEGRLEKIKLYRDAYLGYVVIRPLPYEYFAKICLSTFPSHHRNHKRVITKELPVSFLGYQFCVNTVPMIEQDRIVAACASACIWTFLSTTPSYNLESLPALSTITERAQTQGGPAFPTQGLKTDAIVAAMHASGVQPKKIRFLKEPLMALTEQCLEKSQNEALNNFKHTVFAHLTTQTAVMLTIDVFEKIGTKKNDTVSAYKFKGNHLACVTGYALKENTENTLKKRRQNLHYSADRLDYLYLHDDKFGPYAKLKLYLKPYLTQGTDGAWQEQYCFNYDLLRELDGSGKASENTFAPQEIFKIDGVITGLDPLVRSSSDQLKETFDTLLKILNSSKAKKHFSTPSVEMSISLRKTTALKTKLREHLNKRPGNTRSKEKISNCYHFLSTITEFPESVYSIKDATISNGIELLATKNISTFLETNLPKLIWRVRLRTTAKTNQCSLFCDFLFDATAIPHKSNLICITAYSDSAKTFINKVREAYKKPKDGENDSVIGYLKNILSNAHNNKLNKNELAHLATFEQFFHELDLRSKTTQLAEKYGSLTFAQRRMKISNSYGSETTSVPTIYSARDITKEINVWMKDTDSQFGGEGENKYDTKLAWIIDEQGEFQCMFETSDMSTRQGHISLAEHKPARIAGEIVLLYKPVNNKSLLINTRSGAFSSNYFYEDLKNDVLELDRLEKILTEVVKLLAKNYTLEYEPTNKKIKFISDTDELILSKVLNDEYANSIFLVKSCQ